MKFTAMFLLGLMLAMVQQGDCISCARYPGAYCCASWKQARSCDIAKYCCEKAKCFPAISEVMHSNGHVTNMTVLQVGDIITTVNADGALAPTEVIAFMKQMPHGDGLYKQIATDTGNEVTLSPDHLIISAKQDRSHDFGARYAKDIEVDDFVQVTTGSSVVQISKVVGVKTGILKGAYVPLTKEGTLLVDGVLSSCYAGFENDLAHFFMTPLRWFPMLSGSNLDSVGSHPYVDWVMNIGRWLIPESLQTRQNKVWDLMTKVLPLQTESL